MKLKNAAGKVEPTAPFPFLTKRLANIEDKLASETDDDLKAELQRRKANILAKLAMKQGQQSQHKKGMDNGKGKAKVPFPFLSKRLANIEGKLANETDDGMKAELQKRKASVLAKLAMKQEQQGKCDQGMDNGKDQEKVPFPFLTKRLANIEAKLVDETDEAKRSELEKKKKNVLANLAFKKQQHKPKVACPRIKSRLARIDAMIKAETDEAQLDQLTQRKIFLEAKLAEKEKAHVSYQQGPLWHVQELLSENTDDRLAVEAVSYTHLTLPTICSV